MTLNEVVGGVFIAPNHFLAVAGDGRTEQSGGTSDCHCSLSGARPLGFGAVHRLSALSSCCTRQSSATPDSPVTSDFCALTSDVTLFISVHRVRRALPRREPLLRWLTGKSGEL
jgi:hypothetical protein